MTATDDRTAYWAKRAGIDRNYDDAFINPQISGIKKEIK